MPTPPSCHADRAAPKLLRQAVLVLVAAAAVAGCAAAQRQSPPEPAAARAAEAGAPLALAEGGAVADLAEEVGRNVVFGVPRTPGPVEVLWNAGYTVGYCQEVRSPRWVAYRLFSDPGLSPGPRPSRFIADARVANPVRHDDYNNTGYDRGHMAPNAPIGRRYGPEAQRATFLTTNIVPQLPGLNQRGWEALETIISTDWANRFEEVWVFAGPIYEGECLELECGVRVPSHCYMIVVDIDEGDGTVHALGVIMEQRRIDAEPLSRFVVSVAEIEARTGIDFLHELDDLTELAVQVAAPDARWEVDQVLRPTFPGTARPIRRRPCE